MAACPPASGHISIALAQIHSAPADSKSNLERLDVCIKTLLLISPNVDVVVVPETWLSGYHVLAVSARTQALQLPCKALCTCVGCLGNPLRQVSLLAHRHAVSILVTYPESDVNDPDTVYNSATVFGPRGDTLGHYRKTHLWSEYERTIFRAGPGRPLTRRIAPAALSEGVAGDEIPLPAFPVVYLPTRGGVVPIGLLICFDLEFPEPARTLALNGARVLLCPVAMGDLWGHAALRISRVRAAENNVVLALCNYPSGPAPMPDESVCPGAVPMHCAGGSCIIGPDGVPVTALPVYAIPVDGDARRQPQEHQARIQVGLGQFNDELVWATTVDLDAPEYTSFQARNPYLADRRPELYHSSLL